MAGVNKVIIVGNLGNDPEMRTMPNGEAVANISVATSEAWNDKVTGERREVTEWHRIVFYRRQAEVAGQYLRKGSKVYVEGRLKTRKWTDQNGMERYTTEIQGDVLQMLDSRNQNNGGEWGGNSQSWNQGGGYAPPSQVNNSGDDYSQVGSSGYPSNQTRSKPVPKPVSEPTKPMPVEPAADFDDDIPF